MRQSLNQLTLYPCAGILCMASVQRKAAHTVHETCPWPEEARPWLLPSETASLEPGTQSPDPRLCTAFDKAHLHLGCACCHLQVLPRSIAQAILSHLENFSPPFPSVLPYGLSFPKSPKEVCLLSSFIHKLLSVFLHK